MVTQYKDIENDAHGKFNELGEKGEGKYVRIDSASAVRKKGSAFIFRSDKRAIFCIIN